MDEPLRRRLYQLIAGALLADRRAREDVFLARLAAALELPSAVRDALAPIADASEARRAIAELPVEIRRQSIEHALEAAGEGESDAVAPGALEALAIVTGTALPARPAATARQATSRPPISAGSGFTSVAEVMTPEPTVIGPDTTVGEAYTVMHDGGFRHLPVVHDGRLAGIISTNDIGRLGATVPAILAGVVGAIMTRDPLTIEPDEPIEKAAATMALRKVSCLPVVKGQALVGIVTTYDLLDALARRLRTGR